MSEIQEIQETILEFSKDTFGVRGEVTKLSKLEDGWESELEIIRDDQYKKRHGLPQMIERYSVVLSEEKEVISYQKEETRPRGDVEWSRDE